MRFSTVLAVLAPASAAVAQTVWPVAVGNDSTLTFQPNTVSASVGDIVQFFFTSKNHTVTQSSFAAPCTKLSDNATSSGFMPVDASVTSNVWPGNSSTIPTFNFTVTDTTAPLWFYCAQTNPVSHCESGMVFAINPTANKSFDAFQQAAKALNTSAANTTSTGTSSSSSTSASSTAPPASNSSSPAGALRVGATGALLGGVGLLAMVL